MKIIGGDGGDSDGTKTIVGLAKCVIDKKFVSQITWTGKTNEANKRKVSFILFEKTVKLLRDLCSVADSKYTSQKFDFDIVYKVFKYAYRKNKTKTNAENNDSTSNTEPVVYLREHNNLQAHTQEDNLRRVSNKIDPPAAYPNMPNVQHQLVNLQPPNTLRNNYVSLRNKATHSNHQILTPPSTSQQQLVYSNIQYEQPNCSDVIYIDEPHDTRYYRL